MTFLFCAWGKSIRAAVPLLLALFLASCSRYEFTLNEAVVYSPTPLFTEFEVADANLKACLDQTIKDRHHTAARQLTRLSCSHAGIESLTGLARFTALEELQLSHNQLSALGDLQFLTQLKIVLLDDNRLVNVGELLLLSRLEQLALEANPELHCEDAWQVQRQLQPRISLPKHCKAKPAD